MKVAKKKQHVVSRLSFADRKRFLFIGDVHGCATELRMLLKQVGYAKGSDCVVLVGDLVRKGPLSREVIQLAREEHFLAVQGNHEVKLLKELKKFKHGELPEDAADYELCQSLSRPERKYVKNLPLSIRFPALNLVVVHAGLVNGKALEEHTRFELTEMRGVVDGEAVKTCDDLHVWSRLYQGPEMVIFGHDAARGLQVTPHSRGLDTGAVYGKHLTCLIVEPDNKMTISTVRSLKQYAVPGM